MRKKRNPYMLFKVLGLFFVALDSWTIVQLIRNESKTLNPAPSETSTTVPPESFILQSGPSITVPFLKPSITASSKRQMTFLSKSRKNNNQIQELNKTWKIGNKNGITDRSASNNSRFYQIKQPQYFSIILNNASVCKTSNPEIQVYLIAIVTSARGNSGRRQVIRDTWGSITSVNNLQMRLVFLLGSDHNASESQRKTDEAILNESKKHGDIVLGGFQDSYRNMTYKHLMGYKWVLEHCSEASFVLKTDDDIFVDIYELVKIIKAEQLNNTFLCSDAPSSAPVRSGGHQAAIKEEYPLDFYPAYCSGLAYVVTVDAVRQIVDASQSTRFFWLDDVYVTGILRELSENSAGLLPLNDKYYFNMNFTEALKSFYKNSVKPFVIFLLEDKALAFNMKFLWAAVNSAKQFQENKNQSAGTQL